MSRIALPAARVLKKKSVRSNVQNIRRLDALNSSFGHVLSGQHRRIREKSLDAARFERGSRERRKVDRGKILADRDATARAARGSRRGRARTRGFGMDYRFAFWRSKEWIGHNQRLVLARPRHFQPQQIPPCCEGGG